MNSLWNDREAKRLQDDLLCLRVYTSRLMGQEPSLVLHGGGNTSVKARVRDFFGQSVEVLYIKGSGGDLATIGPQGFAPVRMDALLRMAALKELTDTDMVSQQRAAMLNPKAPNPSVEAILHALIPFRFVDHSHADAIVAITNTPNGKDKIRVIYGDSVLVIPYVMPGFLLAKTVFERTRNFDWKSIKGMILLNHGLFTFADDAQTSYETHVSLVTKAEQYIRGFKVSLAKAPAPRIDVIELAKIRRAVSHACGKAVVCWLKDDPLSVGFSQTPEAVADAHKGTLTPDHVIRTKPFPAVLTHNIERDIQKFSDQYNRYFERFAEKHQRLDAAPRWAVWKDRGVLTFGSTVRDARIVSDVVEHTMTAIQWSRAMGGWKVLRPQDLFEVEYWELEQAKLATSHTAPLFQGKVALVTGGGSGIGKACVDALAAQGAMVVALDIRPEIEIQSNSQVYGIRCDVTKIKDLEQAVMAAVRRYGGLDIVISNAGMFPPSMTLERMEADAWDKSLDLNLSSHQRLLKCAIPLLKHGLDPTAIMVGSKNVPAPGPGAAAYSAAKAGLTQLARIAALELGQYGIRVNVVHPNQVFDTGIWDEETLQKRAKHYGLTVEHYKTDNVLATSITSHHVAQLICAMAGPAFAKTTGAQIPIDGGNERVI